MASNGIVERNKVEMAISSLRSRGQSPFSSPARLDRNNNYGITARSVEAASCDLVIKTRKSCVPNSKTSRLCDPDIETNTSCDPDVETSTSCDRDVKTSRSCDPDIMFLTDICEGKSMHFCK